MDRSPSLPPCWADHPIDGQCSINSERLESRVETSMLHLNPYDHLTGNGGLHSIPRDNGGQRWITSRIFRLRVFKEAGEEDGFLQFPRTLDFSPFKLSEENDLSHTAH